MMDNGKYEFVKNFLTQKTKTSLVNSEEVFLFKNSNVVMVYINYIEFLMIDAVVQPGNEFWKSKSPIYGWLNSESNMNSKYIKEILIGIKMDSKDMSLEFFSIGFFGRGLNSKIYKDLWSSLNSIYGKKNISRAFCKTEFQGTGWVEFSNTSYVEGNPFIYKSEF